MKWFLLAVALLHAVFMLLEMFPWESPFLLGLLSKKLHAGEAFTPQQRELVATIVHNAGIYNGILAVGLVWAALTGESAHDVARVLLAGAAVAGIFRYRDDEIGADGRSGRSGDHRPSDPLAVRKVNLTS